MSRQATVHALDALLSDDKLERLEEASVLGDRCTRGDRLPKSSPEDLRSQVASGQAIHQLYALGLTS